MMNWTDRHCRFFHRILTRRTLLYTEMITAPAVIHGERGRLLGFDAAEHPVALQLGGSEPGELAQAARIGAAAGYDEINLNCGCPSDRVQAGCFGAALMAEPQRVAECVAAMRGAVAVPVTVKCRLGIDEADPEEMLTRFVGRVAEAGCRTFIVHARKAWLKGLSPKENREVPPLDYGIVYRLKRAHPELEVVLNGGIGSLEAALAHLGHVDGVMLGRAAFQNPWLLADADRRLFAEPNPVASAAEAVEAYIAYAARALQQGARLGALVRPLIGLFQGVPGARAWRRHLAEHAMRPGASAEVIAAALGCVRGRAVAEAA